MDPRRASPKAILESAFNAIDKALTEAATAHDTKITPLILQLKTFQRQLMGSAGPMNMFVQEGARSLNQIDQMALLMNQRATRQIKTYEEIVVLSQQSIDDISKKVDDLNALNRNGIGPELTRQFFERRKSAIAKLRSLKTQSSEYEAKMLNLNRTMEDQNLHALAEQVAHASSGQPNTDLQNLQRKLVEQYEKTTGLLFVNQETTYYDNDKDSIDSMDHILRMLSDFYHEKLDGKIDQEAPTVFSDIVTELDTLARYTRHREILANQKITPGARDRDGHLAEARDHYEYLAIAYQIKGLHAKTNEAASMVDDQEIKGRLEETTAYFSDVVRKVHACFGEYVKDVKLSKSNESGIEPLKVAIERRKAFPESNKKLLLKTLANAYADLSVQYRQFQEATTNPSAQALFGRMSDDAAALETRMQTALARLEHVPEIPPASRAKILRNYGLEELAISLEETQTPEQSKVTAVKATGKKKKKKPTKTSTVAPPAPNVEAEPIAQTSQVAENASRQERQEESVVPGIEALQKLQREIASLEKSLTTKKDELTEARKKPDAYQHNPAKRKGEPPEILLIDCRPAAKKANGVGEVYRELAAKYRHVEALGIEPDASQAKTAECVRLEAEYRELASSYETNAKTWYIERTKECLAAKPTDKLVRSLPVSEVESTETKRLKYPVLTNRFGDNNDPYFDIVVQDMISLKGGTPGEEGKKFAMHWHFESTNPDATEEALWQGAGKLVAHSLKTEADALKGREDRAPRKPEDHITIRNPGVVKKAAEDMLTIRNNMKASSNQPGHGIA